MSCGKSRAVARPEVYFALSLTMIHINWKGAAGVVLIPQLYAETESVFSFAKDNTLASLGVLKYRPNGRWNFEVSLRWV